MGHQGHRRPASRGLGGLAGVGLLLGTVLLAFPNIISALLHAHSKSTKKGVFQALATAEVVGGALIIVGILADRGQPARRSADADAVLPEEGDEVPADPWEGQTLEWLTPSPPPLENFLIVPTVASAEPLLDQREEASA